MHQSSVLGQLLGALFALVCFLALIVFGVAGGYYLSIETLHVETDLEDPVIFAIASAVIILGLTLLLLFTRKPKSSFTKGFSKLLAISLLLTILGGIGAAMIYATGSSPDLQRALGKAVGVGLLVAFVFSVFGKDNTATKSTALKTPKPKPSVPKAQRKAPLPTKSAKPVAPQNKTKQHKPPRHWSLVFAGALLKNLLLAALLMTPGMILLFMGQRLAGITAIFVGSFVMMAKSYRKPWALNFLSTVLPILSVMFCYGVQLYLFRDKLPELTYVFGAFGAGSLLGILRAYFHKIEVTERGVFANKTIGFLVLWVIAFGATQALALFATDILYLRAGLLTGALSTGLIVATTFFIWTRKFKAVKLARVTALLLAAGFVVFAVPDASAQSQNTEQWFRLQGFDVQSSEKCVAENGPLPWQGSRCFCKDILGMIETCQWEAFWEEENTTGFAPGYFNQAAYQALAADGRNSIAIWLKDNYSTNGVTRSVLGRNLGRHVSAIACAKSYKYDVGSLPDYGPNGEYLGERIIPATIENGCAHAEVEVTSSRGQAAQDAASAAVKDCNWKLSTLSMVFAVSQHSCSVIAIRSEDGLATDALASTILAADSEAPAQDRETPSAETNYDDGSRRTQEENRQLDILRGSSAADIMTRIRENAGGMDLSTPEGATLAAAAALTAAGFLAAIVQAVSTAFGQAMMAGANSASEALREAVDAASTDMDIRRASVFVDPWDGQEIKIEDGKYWAAGTGQDGEWLSEAQMKSYMEAREADKKAWDEDQAGWEAFNRKNADWRKRNEWIYQQKLASERALEANEKKAKDYVKRLSDAALKRGEIKIYDSLMSDKMYNADGKINRDHLGKVDQIYRRRVMEDMTSAASDTNIKQQVWDDAAMGWASDVDAAITPVKNSFIARTGLGIMSGGTSEIVFQGHTLTEKIWEAEEAAMKAGKNTTFLERLGTGAQVVAEENLPVNTVATLARWAGGDDVTMTDIALNVFSDAAAAFDAKSAIDDSVKWKGYDDTLKDLNKSANTLRRGAKSIQDQLGVPSRFRIPGTTNIQDIFQRPGRLSPTQAGELFQKGTLTKDSEDLFNQVRKDMADGKLSPDTQRAVEAYKAGRTGGQKKVNTLTKAWDDLELERRGRADPEQLKQLERDFRNEVVRVQADKHAMNQMNQIPKNRAPDANGIYTESHYVKGFNTEIAKIYDEADAQMIERLAKKYDVDPSDIDVVKITNMKGDANIEIDAKAPGREHYGRASTSRKTAAPATKLPRDGTQSLTEQANRATRDMGGGGAHGKKVSFDRDMTVRIKRKGPGGKTYWEDVPAAETGKIYNEVFYESATGRSGAKAESGSFIDTHLTKEQHLRDPLDIPPDQADAFAKKTDQATTDRLNAEAYGTGQADLDAATKDVFRGRDLTDAEAVANTVKFKVNHWMNEADELYDMAKAARNQAHELGVHTPEGTAKLREAADLEAAGQAAREEGARQLTKQYKNMGITRTENMVKIGNAPDASLPAGLADDINILRKVETDPNFTIAEAEEVLRRKGTSIKEVSEKLSAFVEAQQTLRPNAPAGQNLWLDAGSGGRLAINKAPLYFSSEQERPNNGP